MISYSDLGMSQLSDFKLSVCTSVENFFKNLCTHLTKVDE